MIVKLLDWESSKYHPIRNVVLSVIIGVGLLVFNYLGYYVYGWYHSYLLYLALLMLGALYASYLFVPLVAKGIEAVLTVSVVLLFILLFIDGVWWEGWRDYLGSAIDFILIANVGWDVWNDRDEYDSYRYVNIAFYGVLIWSKIFAPIIDKIKDKKDENKRKAHENTQEYKDKLALLEKLKQTEDELYVNAVKRARQRLVQKNKAANNRVSDIKKEGCEKARVCRQTYLEKHQSKFNYGSFTDSRDGRTYKTVTIGKQTWMAEILKLNGDARYSWATAMGLPQKYDNGPLTDSTIEKIKRGNYQGIAPAGWHIPSRFEWQQLINYVEEHCEYSAYDALRAEGDAWGAWIKDIDKTGSTITRYSEGKDVFGMALMPRSFKGELCSRNIWTTDWIDDKRAYCVCVGKENLSITSMDKTCLIIGLDFLKESASIEDYEKTANVICIKDTDAEGLAESQFLRKADEERQKADEERRHREYLEKLEEKRLRKQEQALEEQREALEEQRERQEKLDREDRERRKNEQYEKDHPKFYCKYCGKEFDNSRAILNSFCPFGPNRNHVLR